MLIVLVFCLKVFVGLQTCFNEKKGFPISSIIPIGYGLYKLETYSFSDGTCKIVRNRTPY